MTCKQTQVVNIKYARTSSVGNFLLRTKFYYRVLSWSYNTLGRIRCSEITSFRKKGEFFWNTVGLPQIYQAKSSMGNVFRRPILCLWAPDTSQTRRAKTGLVQKQSQKGAWTHQFFMREANREPFGWDNLELFTRYSRQGYLTCVFERFPLGANSADYIAG